MALSNEEALYLFVDGELDVQTEESLFAELAFNTDLRSEFRDLLLIRNGVITDVAIPPANGKNNLLAAVGLEPINAVPGAHFASQLGISSIFSVILDSTWFRVLSPLLTGVAGAVIMWLFLTPNSFFYTSKDNSNDIGIIDSSLLNKKDDTGTVTTSNSSSQLLQSAKKSNSNGLEQPQEQTQSPTKEIQRLTGIIRKLKNELRQPNQNEYIINRNIHNSLANTLVNTSNKPETLDSRNSNSVIANTVTNVNNHVGAVLNPGSHYATQPEVIILDRMPTIQLAPEAGNYAQTQNGAISLRFRGTATQSITQTQLQAQSTTMLDNLYIGAIIQGSSLFSVGVEIGREAFVQNYEGIMNNRLSQIEQYPQLWNAGIVMHYPITVLDNSGNTTWFGETTFGGVVNGGPFLRQTTGLRYSVANDISMIAGIQGTAMAFQFQDNWFTSTKYGVMYGIQYNFNK